jgi:Protein of unknown function (DUF1592)/Protein of unknown function (DUF1588)/Protein of unknown function (DUF1587)/Protein of unknown function (DUF1585)/Protein of unknown function (DUF1595)/Planctomycete cytochrome C
MIRWNRLKTIVLLSGLSSSLGCGRDAVSTADAQHRTAAKSALSSLGARRVTSRPRRTLSPNVPPDFQKAVAPLLDRYCMECHDRAAARGGVVLEAMKGSKAQDDRPLWERVADALRSGDMPPDGEPAPTAGELETLNSWLDVVLVDQDQSRRPAAPRRLNRAEYNNTIRDLVGLDLRPADEFPNDDLGHGFDNNGDVLTTSPILFDMLMDAADEVTSRAFATPEIRTRIMNPEPDRVPRDFRQYTPPVRAFREKDRAIPRLPVEDPELIRAQRIYDILRAFADRAFRRPATHAELMKLLGIVDSAEKDGDPLEAAIQTALRAILVSPHFLFRFEPPRDARQSAASAETDVDDFALASRLSYFLWSSMPDDELLALAAQRELRDPATLEKQVRRMLADPNSRALDENFGDQWLQTRALKTISPDARRFPNFDEALRAAMISETRLFFASIHQEDRSVLDFLEGDYTFLNGRLARHYGVAGVDGAAFRRVSLAGTERGGVLTQAGILAITSHATRTSPVKRGRWILENILGSSPAPPPSGVEALDETGAGGSHVTLRARMERHARAPACAGCHRRMDPLGFGLENFDAIGGWRTEDDGRPIEAAGALPGRRAFHGPAQLRATFAARREVFARCLAEKMATYAVGRGIERADRRDVDEIVRRLRQNQYRFSALVLAIVESAPFQESPSEGVQHP